MTRGSHSKGVSRTVDTIFPRISEVLTSFSKRGILREKYFEMELKIKQLEIELKSMKELNSHLKIFLKKKIVQAQESTENCNDTVDLTATQDKPKSQSAKNSPKAKTTSSSSEDKKSKKRKNSNDESNGRLKKRLVTIYGDSGLKE